MSIEDKINTSNLVSSSRFSPKTREQFDTLQKKIEQKYNEYIMKEFQLKLDFQEATKNILNERDSLLLSLPQSQLKELMSMALENFTEIHSMLPIVIIGNDECYDCEFIKFIKAEYMEGYKIKVTIDLFENNYIEETKLERTFGFVAKEDMAMQLKYKNGAEPCPLFTYFEADDEALEMFDLFYEFYVNLTFYAFMNSEE